MSKHNRNETFCSGCWNYYRFCDCDPTYTTEFGNWDNSLNVGKRNKKITNIWYFYGPLDLLNTTDKWALNAILLYDKLWSTTPPKDPSGMLSIPESSINCKPWELNFFQYHDWPTKPKAGAGLAHAAAKCMRKKTKVGKAACMAINIAKNAVEETFPGTLDYLYKQVPEYSPVPPDLIALGVPLAFIPIKNMPKGIINNIEDALNKSMYPDADYPWVNNYYNKNNEDPIPSDFIYGEKTNIDKAVTQLNKGTKFYNEQRKNNETDTIVPRPLYITDNNLPIFEDVMDQIRPDYNPIFETNNNDPQNSTPVWPDSSSWKNLVKKKPYYDIKIGSGLNGSVETDMTNPTNLIYNAIPDPGYRFKQWKNNIFPYQPLYTETIIIPRNSNVNLTAEFELIPNEIEIIADAGPNGTISRDDTDANNVIVTAIPDTGYQFKRWSDNLDLAGQIFYTDNPLYLPKTQNADVTAEFELIRYIITYDCDPTRGTINESLSTNTNGQTVHTLTCIPEEDHYVVNWIGNKTKNNVVTPISYTTNVIEIIEDANYNVYCNIQITALSNTLQTEGQGIQSNLYRGTNVINADCKSFLIPTTSNNDQNALVITTAGNSRIRTNALPNTMTISVNVNTNVDAHHCYDIEMKTVDNNPNISVEFTSDIFEPNTFDYINRTPIGNGRKYTFPTGTNRTKKFRVYIAPNTGSSFTVTSVLAFQQIDILSMRIIALKAMPATAFPWIDWEKYNVTYMPPLSDIVQDASGVNCTKFPSIIDRPKFGNYINNPQHRLIVQGVGQKTINNPDNPPSTYILCGSKQMISSQFNGMTGEQQTTDQSNNAVWTSNDSTARIYYTLVSRPYSDINVTPYPTYPKPLVTQWPLP